MRRHYNQSVLTKRRFLGLLLIVTGIAMTLMKAGSTHSDKGPALFYIGGISEQIGQFPVKDGLVHYSVSFDNPTNRSFRIKKIEPLLTQEAQSRLLEYTVSIEEEKKLSPGKEIEFTGQFHIDTSDLTEAEIAELFPIIEGYRVTYNRHEEIIMPLPNVLSNN